MSVRVLIVDDEIEFLDALSERLEIRGFEVSRATNGADALVKVAAEPADVVLLDVMMPGQSGIDTLVQIKQRFPGVPVIMLSGHADVETAISGMEIGAFDYLVKPVDFDELYYRIEDACKKDESGDVER